VRTRSQPIRVDWFLRTGVPSAPLGGPPGTPPFRDGIRHRAPCAGAAGEGPDGTHLRSVCRSRTLASWPSGAVKHAFQPAHRGGLPAPTHRPWSSHARRGRPGRGPFPWTRADLATALNRLRAIRAIPAPATNDHGPCGSRRRRSHYQKSRLNLATRVITAEGPGLALLGRESVVRRTSASSS